MSQTRTWFDEIDFFHHNTIPETTSAYAQMWETLAMSHSWVNAFDQEQAQRTYAKVKRRKEQENCLHGQRPFQINWQPGVHPLGERTFYANIEGLPGGPYLLNETDHQILHNVGRKHTHVSERFK
jgi:hypothetical protein